jgi:hypothetical protein
LARSRRLPGSSVIPLRLSVKGPVKGLVFGGSSAGAGGESPLLQNGLDRTLA